jgi:hypothetical protein
MENRRLFKHELIEITIPKSSTLSKFYLPDLPNLRNVHLFGLESYTNAQLPKSIISGNNVIPMAILQSAFITLQSYNGKNFCYQLPLLDLKFLSNPAGGENQQLSPIVFVGQKINYPKSYIEIADTSLISAVENQVILLGNIYCEIKSIEEQDKKAEFLNRS